MASNDHRTKEQLRILLIREWVDLSRLTYGVVNGVVFLRGELRSRETFNGGSPAEELASLAERLEVAAKSLPEVHDIVFSFENLHKNGGGWEKKH